MTNQLFVIKGAVVSRMFIFIFLKCTGNSRYMHTEEKDTWRNRWMQYKELNISFSMCLDFRWWTFCMFRSVSVCDWGLSLTAEIEAKGWQERKTDRDESVGVSVRVAALCGQWELPGGKEQILSAKTWLLVPLPRCWNSSGTLATRQLSAEEESSEMYWESRGKARGRGDQGLELQGEKTFGEKSREDVEQR